MTDEHIDEILRAFADKKNIEHFAKMVPYNEIVAQDYNLSVSTYVERQDDREQVDIDVLNSDIEAVVEKINHLRHGVNTLIANI